MFPVWADKIDSRQLGYATLVARVATLVEDGQVDPAEVEMKACAVDDTADAGPPQVEDRWFRGRLPVNGLRNTFWRRDAAVGDVVVDERQRLDPIFRYGISKEYDSVSCTHVKGVESIPRTLRRGE